MITTYAVTLTSDPAPDSAWIEVVDLVSDWLADHYPVEERPAGTFVRWREAKNDPVCRLAIDTNPPRSTHSNLLTVTMIRDKGRIIFDLRNVTRPLTNQIIPGRGVGLPRRLLVQLVHSVLGLLTVRDAELRVTPEARPVATAVDGQAIAALIGAPSRRLPLVVEVIDTERGTPAIFAAGAGPLAGLAHVFVIENADALAGFAEMSGERLVGPGVVATYWAGTRDHEMFSRRGLPDASLSRHRDALVTRIIDTAARSLAAPRVPPPPVDDDDAPGIKTPDELGGGEAVYAAYEEGLRRIEELESAVASADRIIADQREKLEQRGHVIDELVLQKVNMEIGSSSGRVEETIGGDRVKSMADAMRLAVEYCSHLTFLPSAVDTGLELQGPEPLAVLKDLGRLNNAARAWQSGEINDESFGLVCQKFGLNYAAGVGQVAEQKYAADYLISWRGKPALADAHVRRGKGNHLYRIYFHLDSNAQEVVVARIVRHLRGKRDS